MRRAGSLFPRIIDPDNLRLAFCKARRGKEHRPEVQEFSANVSRELATIRGQLVDGTMAIGDYHRFIIRDPKERLICAAAFRERVLHHAIMNVCEHVFERYAIFDSYACRVGKGAHAAVRRAQQFACRFPFCLKADVAKYFDSIDHSVLGGLLARLFREKPLLDLLWRIIESYEARPGKGLPIGSLTSQHFANHYLGTLDHFAKEALRVPGYVRYMDDILLWGRTREELRGVHVAVREFLARKLALELKPDAQLKPVGAGVSFLGFRVFPQRIGLTRRSRRRFVDKFRGYERRLAAGLWSEEEAACHLQSLVGFTLLADATGFRRRVISQFGAPV